LDSVSVCAAAVPLAGATKSNDSADKLSAGAAGATPVPASATASGVLALLALTVRLALRAPVAVGVKPRTTVHCAPAASDCPALQLELPSTRKSAAWLPPSVKSPSVAVPLPLFDRVSVWVVASSPTVMLPKSTAAPSTYCRSPVVASTPVPVRPTLCGEPLALLLTLRLPLAAPAPLGVKTTLIAQLAPAASVLPQAWLALNGLAAVMALMLSVALPLLVSVTIRAVELLPTVTLPNARLAGARLASGVATAWPVPLSDTVALPLDASDASVSEALRLPVVLGVKRRPSVHELPAATGVPTAQPPLVL
jgi:hypothetical protein